MEGLANWRPVLVALKYNLMFEHGEGVNRATPAATLGLSVCHLRITVPVYYDKEGMLLRTYPYLNSHGYLIDY